MTDIGTEQLAAAELLAQKRLRFLLSSTPAMIYTCTATREFRITFISDNVALELGYEPRAFLEEPLFWISRIHPDDIARAHAEVPSVLERGHRVCAYRFLHDDGTYRWLRDEARLITDAEGTPLEVAGYLLDITERKLAEAELIRKARQFAEAQSVAHVGSWDWDVVNDSAEWSNEQYRIFGLKHGDFSPTYESVMALIHPDDRKQVDESLCRAFEGGRPFSAEFRIIRPDGAERWLSGRGVIVRDSAGRPIRMHGTVQDITELRRVMDALRHSEDRFSAFMRNLPAAAFIRDGDGRYLYANAIASERHRTSVVSWEDKTVDEVFPADVAAQLKATDRQVLDNGEVIQMVEQTSNTEGTRYWLVSKFPLRDMQGKTNLLGGVGIDITEQKRVEEELRKTEAQLRAMLEERERLSQDLHDGIIQTIYAVGLSLEECQRLMAEDQRLDAIQTVGGAISRLNGAIREIRQFIGGTAPADTTARDLRAELAELAKTVRASRLMQLHVNVDPAVAAQLSSDEAHHLLSIAREAMSNSLRHSHAAWATVKLQARADHIRFELVDDGVGFDPAAVSTGGHGLKNIAARADLIGAGLDVISGSGHGTRIVLNLPKKASHANIHRRRSSAADRR